MYFRSKTTSLLILGATAIACSKAFFAFLNDPEGPNLLVVTAMAAILYGLSLAAYLSGFFLSVTGLKRLSVTVLMQILLTAGLCLGLR